MASERPESRIREILREGILSSLLGAAVVFLMFLGRAQGFGLRLFVYGLFAGLCVFATSRALHQLVSKRIHELALFPRVVVAAATFFVAGAIGWTVSIVVASWVGLVHLHVEARDVAIGVGIAGAIAVGAGLAFYSFGRMQDRLRQSVSRLKEAEFAEKELELARAMQARLLPPPLVEGEGYRIEARNLPARYVAGDFYDVFRLSGGSIGLVVADVAGKGVAASLTMASVKAVLPLLAGDRAAGETLRELNRRLARELAPREFVALLYGKYDPISGELELANAGLPDPYRLTEGFPPQPLSVSGPRLPLGAWADVAYESVRATLAVGDRVLFVTDGLPEAIGGDGAPIGYEKLAGLIEAQGANEQGWLDSFFARVLAASSPAREDDWTALLLERRALSAGGRSATAR